MLLASELTSMAVGDVLQVPPLFSCTPREMTNLELFEVSDDKASFQFRVTWCNVIIGVWTAVVEAETIKWSLK